MNLDFFMEYLSYQLHTIVRKYKQNHAFGKKFCARFDFSDPFSDRELLSFFPCRTVKESSLEAPVLLSINDQIVYALIPLEDCSLILGPVRFSQYIYLKNVRTVSPLDEGWKETVPLCEWNTFTTQVLLAFNLFHARTLREQELLSLNCVNPSTEENLHEYFSQLVFENRESGRHHNPYDQENREFSSIEQGDLVQLKRSLEEDYPGEIGTLAKTPLRQAKNRGIVVVTLASRAAIRGGVAAELAYSLSDSYIQKIEECRDIPSVFHLFYQSEFEYAQMVKDNNAQKEGTLEIDKNPHIRKCKDYIFSHLHDKIQVQDIADTLGLNANYLSELFHSCEKISLTRFIRREKMNLVKNLLVYSPYSYSQIATYLGFASQSHLGAQFKKDTGMTMRQYRNLYGRREFH